MQILLNTLIDSMILLLNYACIFKQKTVRSVVNVAFKVSKINVFPNTCIILWLMESCYDRD
jgi:hypothetical protein